MIGTDAVAKAAPDGTTFGVSVVGPLVNNKQLYQRMPFGSIGKVYATYWPPGRLTIR